MALQLESIELEIKYSSKKAEKDIDKLADALNDAGKAVDKATSRFAKIRSAIGELSNTALGSITKVAGRMLTINAVSSIIGKAITKSNEYVENLNLFTVAMGDFASEAQEYAENVGNLLGIDPSDWMRMQGVFMTLGTGFGVASDKAALMSKNLTQLSYDLSSFYNISVADSAQKLQSAFSGELEPVRRLGYDLSQTRLQQVAYEQGINQMVSTMTQAEKSQLRYIALIEQVSQVHGDMARTIKSPANQIRIFQAQIEQLVRALGNIFIPMLNAVLPYIIAFTKALRNLAQTIANFFGYTLPEVDYSTVVANNSAITDSIDDTADAYGGATKAAKAYKNTILGIDEIHKLNDKSASAGGGGGGASVIGGGDNFAFELPEYDFLAGFVDDARDLEGLMENVLNIVGLIGAGLLTWKIASAVTDFFKKFTGPDGDAMRTQAAITLIVTGVVISFEAGFSIGKDGANWGNVLSAIGGILAAGLGGVLLSTTKLGAAIGIGSTGVGLAIGLSIGIVATLVGIILGYKQGLKENWENSEAYKNMQKELEAVKNSETVIKQFVIEVQTKLEGVEETQIKFDFVRDLIQEMYDAIGRGESQESIQGYIDYINAFEIKGLKLDYSQIVEGKDALYDLIDALEKEALVEGYREVWIESLKDQAAAEVALKKSNIERDKAQREFNKTNEKYLDLLPKKQRYEELLTKARYRSSEVTKAERQEIEQLREVLGVDQFGFTTIFDQAETDMQGAKTILDEINVSIGEQETELLELSETTDYASGRMRELTGAAIGTDTALEDAGEAGKQAGNEIGTGATNATRQIQFLSSNGQVYLAELDGRVFNVSKNVKDLGGQSKTTEQALKDMGIGGNNAIQKFKDAARTAGIDIKNLQNYFGDFGTKSAQAVLKIRGAFVDLTDAMKIAKKNFPEMTSQVRVGTTEYYLRMNGYATGGYPRQGELFLARESGPELVGSIGGQTAVANNQDIVAGISQGVYNAMRAAGGNGGTTVVQVVKDGYIESEQIINSADRRNRRDGKTIISVGS